MPSVNIDLLSLFSGHPIDKIVAPPGETIVTNDGTSLYYDEAKIVTASLPNPYGKRVFARARWSVDNRSSWQMLDSRLTYAYSITSFGFTTALTGLRAGISIGVSDAGLHFRTANGYHGNVTDNGIDYVYTPISQTFIIQYALFEIV